MKVNDYKITGTFKHGKLIAMGLFIAMDILVGIGLLFGLAILIFEPAETYAIYPLLMSLVISALCSWLTGVQVRHRKDIKLWLQDAVIAECLMQNASESFGGAIRKHEYIMTVKCDGKKIVLQPRTFYTRRSTGFVQANYYNKYSDRKMQSLYSPKYNQVIFIQQPERTDEIS